MKISVRAVDNTIGLLKRQRETISSASKLLIADRNAKIKTKRIRMALTQHCMALYGMSNDLSGDGCIWRNICDIVIEQKKALSVMRAVAEGRNTAYKR